MTDIPPIPLGYEVPRRVKPRRLADLIAIGASTVFMGLVVGASTNAIDALVSPAYFRSVMGWQGEVWDLSVVQGAFEGTLAGVILALVLTIALGVMTGARMTYGRGLAFLARVALMVYGFWFVGGVLGVAVAAYVPQVLATLIGVPQGYAQTLRYAWVGGSIWGAYAGGPIALIVGLVALRTRWRHLADADGSMSV